MIPANNHPEIDRLIHLKKHLGGMTMSKLISYQFNIDTACVELVFDDRSQISIDFTAVEISIKRVKRQWCNIDKDTYIEADGIRYTMTYAEGIATAPEKTYFPDTEYEVTFTLYFPPIPKSAASMHLIESTYSDFRFYGIQLR